MALVPTSRLVALALLAVALPGEARGAQVSLAVRGPALGSPLEVRLVAEPLDGRPTSDRREVAARVSDRADVDVPIDGAKRWRLRALAEGFWSDPVVVESGDRSIPQLTLWPAGSVAGGFGPFSGAGGLPESMLIRFEQGGKSGDEIVGSGGPVRATVPTGVEEVPIERGRWRCVVPAGVQNLRIRIKGYATIFRMDVLVKSGETADLGDLEVPAGSSVVGRIVRPKIAPDQKEGASKEAQVLILRSVAKKLVPEGKLVFGFDGVFAATGLPSGHYMVVASGAGYLSDRLEVDLGGSDEIELPPLSLNAACRIQVEVNPPADPRGGAWQVLLLDARPGRGQAPVHEASANPSGRWAFDRAAGGRPYRLKVKTSWDETWWVDDAEFIPSDQKMERKIRMDPVKIAGTARLGKEGLGGQIVFEDRGVSVRMAMGHGLFAGLLPRAGGWKARVLSDAPPVIRSLDVDVPSGGGEVTLDLPATAVEGEVVDEAGARVPGVTLYVTRVNPVESAEYDLDDGAILLGGLAAGEYKALARGTTPHRESLIYRFKVNEDGSSDPFPLRIVATLKRKLQGRVVSPDGRPLPGARIQLTASAGDIRVAMGITEKTDADGRFGIDIRADQETPCLVVMPQGLPIRILQVSDRDEEQKVVVAPEGGVLSLRSEKRLGQSSPPAGQSLKYLMRENCVFAVLVFETLGGTFSIVGGESFLATPPVEPGTYTLCGLMPGEISSFTGGRPSYANCSTGVLTNRKSSPNPVVTKRGSGGTTAPGCQVVAWKSAGRVTEPGDSRALRTTARRYAAGSSCSALAVSKIV